MLRAFKYRIYPNEAQIQLIEKTIGCSRFIYNSIKADYEKQRENNREGKFKTPVYFKTEYTWLKEVDSLALCNAQLDLKSAYNKFFKEIFPKVSKLKNIEKKYNKKALKKFKENPEYKFTIQDMKGFPRFHSKHSSKQSYTTNNVNNSIRIEHGMLRLPKLGLINVKFHRWCKGSIRSVTVSKSVSGKYFVSILTEYFCETPQQIKEEKVLGIDMSLECLAAYSDGTKAKYPKYYKKAEKRLAHVQRNLSRKVNGSKNKEKNKLQVAKLHEKVANQRRNFLYNEAAKLLKDYNVIVVEDINLQGIGNKKSHHGKSTHDIGFGLFRSILSYKLEEMSGKLIKANKFFPSSQLCNSCGYKNPEVKDLQIRKWVCPKCGTTHDRDINAAINLKNYYTTATVGIQDCGEDVRPLEADFSEAVKIAV